MWNLKYDTNETIYETNRIRDIENRLVIAKQGGGGRGLGWIGSLELADANLFL